MTEPRVHGQLSFNLPTTALPGVVNLLQGNNYNGVEYILKGVFPISSERVIIWIDEIGSTGSPFRRNIITDAIESVGGFK